MTDDFRRVHFLGDFEEYAPSHEPKLYRCARCGTEIVGEVGCYEHRRGPLSPCDRLCAAAVWRRWPPVTRLVVLSAVLLALAVVVLAVVRLVVFL